MAKSKADKKEALINDVTELLYENLGSFAQEKYKQFYRNRTEREILLSCQEILGELIGERQTKKFIEELSKKYKVKLHEK